MHITEMHMVFHRCRFSLFFCVFHIFQRFLTISCNVVSKTNEGIKKVFFNSLIKKDDMVITWWLIIIQYMIPTIPWKIAHNSLSKWKYFFSFPDIYSIIMLCCLFVWYLLNKTGAITSVMNLTLCKLIDRWYTDLYVPH